MERKIRDSAEGILIYPKFASLILTKAGNKLPKSKDYETVKVTNLNNELTRILIKEDKFQDVNIHQSFYKDLASKASSDDNTPVDIAGKPKKLKAFFALIWYLGANLPAEYDSSEVFSRKQSLIQAIKDLHAKEIIVLKEIQPQLKLLEQSDYNPIYWDHFYVCYFSRGASEPDAALIKIDKLVQKVYMKFYKRRKGESEHSGTIEHIAGNIFINVKNNRSNIPSLLSLKTDRPSVRVTEASELRGYYCSTLDYEGGIPAAGYLIITREINEDEATKKINPDGEPDIPDSIYQLLYNKRFSNQLAETYLPYKGIYKGFWYLFKEGKQEIRQIKLEIKANGKARISDYNMQTDDGIAFFSTKDRVLRMYFDYREERGYRLYMLFRITDSTAEYFDGVYTGQRFNNDNQLMAGKIRLYKMENLTYESLPVRPYQFTKDLPEGLENAKSLVNFFLGIEDDGPKDHFLQPTLPAFRTYLGLQESVPPDDPRLKRWAGLFRMYRLDSSKKNINVYDLTLYSDTTVEYILHEEQDSGLVKITYKGIATISRECLVFSISKKNDKPSSGLFLFWIGGEKRDESTKLLNGVYASLSAVKGSPLSGRVVLITVPSNKVGEPVRPIPLGHDNYYVEDEQTNGLMRYLTGEADNILEAPMEINYIRRSIDYSSLFFGYACSIKNKAEECLKYLQIAFEHGFSNIAELKKQLESGGSLDIIADRIEITPSEDKPNQVTVILHKTDELFTKLVRFKLPKS